MITAIFDKQAELSELCERFGVERLELFGSAATDEEFDPARSDLDFIVQFRADHGYGPWLENYFAFRDELSSLFGCPVDLVISSAMRNPFFIREANRTRRLLYGA